MAAEVFISHSSKDKRAADAACATLESHGIRCWMTPRDIRPGDDWATAIARAIRSTRVMVLIFSRHANESPHIRREVERAVNAGSTIIPVRIEDVLPKDALEFFLNSPHWLDAFPPPFEHHLDRLAGVIKENLKLPRPPRRDTEDDDVQEDPAPPPRREPEKSASPAGWLIGVGVGVGVLVLCGLAYLIWGRPAVAYNPPPPPSVVTNTVPTQPSAPGVSTITEKPVPAANTPPAQSNVPPPPVVQTPPPAASSSVDPAVLGVWHIKINLAKFPPGVMSETYNTDGTYKLETVLTDSGTYTFGGGHFSMTSTVSGKVQAGDYNVSNPQTLVMGQFPWTTTGAPLDSNNPNFVGTWNGTLYLPNSTPWQLTMTVKADGTYSMRQENVDGGTFTAANGIMSCKVNSSGATVPMSYQLVDQDSMIFTSPSESATWSRKKP
jgi:hypothetical protein